MKQYILTIKLPKNPNHNPRSKIVGDCTVNTFCTDKTGEHHSLLVEAIGPATVQAFAEERGWHVTRIEKVDKVITL